MTNDNLQYYQDAYESVTRRSSHLRGGHQHVDQGLSLTLFFMDTATTVT